MVGHPDNGVRQERDTETGTAGAVGGGELIQLQADIWGKAILGTELHGALVGNGLRAKQQEWGLCEGREGDGRRSRRIKITANTNSSTAETVSRR